MAVLCGRKSPSASRASPSGRRAADGSGSSRAGSIENKVHQVRDVTFDEDRSQIRRGAGAQVMATLRNTAMNLLRMAGVDSIARGLRHGAHHPLIAARLLGLHAA